jgi:long-chain acyl-CoA synthetase
MKITRVFEVLEKLNGEKHNPTLLNKKVGKEWVSYSTSDFIKNVNFVSYGLLALGLKQGDVAAIISTNRPEWNFFDYGCQQVGLVTVPIFPTITTHDLPKVKRH